MNLNQEEPAAEALTPPPKKKPSRKEKRNMKQAAKTPAKGEPIHKSAKPATAQTIKTKPEVSAAPEEVSAQLHPPAAAAIPAPKYTLWERISPGARRRRQLANMENGFREVLGLVQAMRQNQEILMDAFHKLPEAVDSVKKLADHSAQQSDLLKAMSEQMGAGSGGKFNDTLASMDRTTQLLLERAQRSEERLYSMLRGAQRRIAFMTLLVVMLFLGALLAGWMIAFPESSNQWLRNRGLMSPAPESPAKSAALQTPPDFLLIPPAPKRPPPEANPVPGPTKMLPTPPPEVPVNPPPVPEDGDLPVSNEPLDPPPVLPTREEEDAPNAGAASDPFPGEAAEAELPVAPVEDAVIPPLP